MSRCAKFLILALAGGAMLALSVPSDSVAQGKQPDGKFSGVPRDIDFIKNLGLTQVILQGEEELVAQTKNDRIQSILLVALSLKNVATVEYVQDNPKTLKSVSLLVKAKAEQGYVSALSVDEKDKYCRAVVYDQSKKVNVWTASVQMQCILETAVRQSIPILEFTYDPGTMEITRGKVNVEIKK